MAAAIPFLIGAATVGAAAYTISSSLKQAKQADKAAQAVQQQNSAAIQEVKTATSTASEQAQNVIRARRASATQTIYTSPLGIAGQANVSRKTLLGQ